MMLPFFFAAIGYFLYGWGATAGAHWMTLAVGLCFMTAEQVAANSIATAYAMECFDGVCRLSHLFYICGCA